MVEPVHKSSETGTSPRSAQTDIEMNMKGVRCFICKQKGHMAKLCPDSRKKTSFLVTLQGTETGATNETVEMVEEPDPWMRTLTVREQSSDEMANTRGPCYRVDLVVEGIKTRGFLDHGAQVSLIRKEMLPVIRKKRGWTVEECHQRNLKMGGQPVGATGDPLGVISLVHLQMLVESFR